MFSSKTSLFVICLLLALVVTGMVQDYQDGPEKYRVFLNKLDQQGLSKEKWQTARPGELISGTGTVPIRYLGPDLGNIRLGGPLPHTADGVTRPGDKDRDYYVFTGQCNLFPHPYGEISLERNFAVAATLYVVKVDRKDMSLHYVIQKN